MVLSRQLQAVPGSDITPIATEADWPALAALVRRDHEEGARTGGAILSAKVTDEIVAGYRAKDGPYRFLLASIGGIPVAYGACAAAPSRSEEHTSELQSLMRISYAVFCLTKKKQNTQHINNRCR